MLVFSARTTVTPRAMAGLRGMRPSPHRLCAPDGLAQGGSVPQPSRALSPAAPFPPCPLWSVQASAPGWGTEANPWGALGFTHTQPPLGRLEFLMLVKLLMSALPNPVFVLSQEPPKFS